MEWDESFKRRVIFAVVFLLLFIAVVGVVYWLFATRNPNSLSEPQNLDSDTREIVRYERQTLAKVHDYTSLNIAPAQEVKINGKFVSADFEQTNIDGENYIYVIGVQNEDGSVTKVHLTNSEYEIIGGSLPRDKFFVTRPVVVTVSALGVYIEAF